MITTLSHYNTQMILLLNIILNKQKIYLARAKTIPYRFLKYLFHHKNKMIKIKLCKKKKKRYMKNKSGKKFMVIANEAYIFLYCSETHFELN